jgi:transcriptional regulator with XRE-family HTH domain
MPKTIFTGANQAVVQTVKEARLSAGLRQEDVAARLGRDQSWVSLIEGSQRRVDVVEFIELAKAIGVEPASLFAKILSRYADLGSK